MNLGRAGHGSSHPTFQRRHSNVSTERTRSHQIANGLPGAGTRRALFGEHSLGVSLAPGRVNPVIRVIDLKAIGACSNCSPTASLLLVSRRLICWQVPASRLRSSRHFASSKMCG